MTRHELLPRGTRAQSARGAPAWLRAGGLLLVVPALLLALAASDAAGAPAKGVHSNAALAAVVKTLQACVSRLPAGDRQVIELRFGAAPKTQPAIAAQLHESTSAVAQAEVAAVQALEALNRHRGCAPRAGRTSTVASRSAAGSAGGGLTASHGLSWTSSKELALLAVIALCALGLVYIVYRELRPRS